MIYSPNHLLEYRLLVLLRKFECGRWQIGFRCIDCQPGMHVTSNEYSRGKRVVNSSRSLQCDRCYYDEQYYIFVLEREGDL